MGMIAGKMISKLHLSFEVLKYPVVEAVGIHCLRDVAFSSTYLKYFLVYIYLKHLVSSFLSKEELFFFVSDID